MVGTVGFVDLQKLLLWSCLGRLNEQILIVLTEKTCTVKIMKANSSAHFVCQLCVDEHVKIRKIPRVGTLCGYVCLLDHAAALHICHACKHFTIPQRSIKYAEQPLSKPKNEYLSSANSVDDLTIQMEFRFVQKEHEALSKAGSKANIVGPESIPECSNLTPHSIAAVVGFDSLRRRHTDDVAAKIGRALLNEYLAEVINDIVPL